MGAAELWTADDALYRFTESTSLDPTHGDIIVEPAELRRRMIHVRRTAVDIDEQMHQDDTIDYAAMRTRPIDRTMPNAYTPHLRHAFMVSALCNNASVKRDDQGNWTTVGDPTEVALTVAAQKANLGRDHWTTTEGMQKVFERAFDSERKLMSTIYRPSTENDNKGQLYVLCKGAPEELLRKCTTYLTPTTTASPSSLSSPLPPPPPMPSALTNDTASSSSSTMTDNSSSSKNNNNDDALDDGGIASDQGVSSNEHDNHTLTMNDIFATKVTDESSRMASQGLRVLGLAFKRVPDMDDEKLESIGENDFTFLGLIGLIDPPKQGVKESVETCQQAGIRVMMITGDHVETAVAIASQLGIFKRDTPGMVK